jgi:hypothetical protein
MTYWITVNYLSHPIEISNEEREDLRRLPPGSVFEPIAAYQYRGALNRWYIPVSDITSVVKIEEQPS